MGEDVNTKSKTLNEILEEAGISSNPESNSQLVLWNDDHNTFEWVIINLMTLLSFTMEKAEKTAWNVHLKGKDVLKSGSKDSLMPYKKLLEERGLTVTIEE
jgi:ATP-dependent Clp protease adaptor protein ClpS